MDCLCLAEGAITLRIDGIGSKQDRNNVEYKKRTLRDFLEFPRHVLNLLMWQDLYGAPVYIA